MPRRRLGSRGYPKSTQTDSQCQWNTLEPVVAISIVSLSPSPIWQDQDVEKSRALFTNEINNEVEGIGPIMRSKMRQRDWSSESNQDQDIYPIFIYIFNYIFNFNYLQIFQLLTLVHYIVTSVLRSKVSPNKPTRKENGSWNGTKVELLFSIKRIVFFQRLWTSLDLSNQ